MKLEPWWEQWDGRLDWELAELDRRGIRHELDQDWLDAHRAVRVYVWPRVNGEEKDLLAVYPDLYPYFRPEVYARTESFEKHQAPFEKNLCLLDRPADTWRVAEDSLAELLDHQLPRVYEAQTSSHADQLEVHQAEPFSFWYPYAGNTGFVVDGSWTLDANGGTFDYVVVPRVGVDQPLVGFVLTVRDRNGREIAEADEALIQLWGELERRVGYWARLDAPPSTSDPHEVRRILARRNRDIRRSEPEPFGNGRHPRRLEVTAAVFPDEVAYDREKADSWVFVVTLDPPASREERRTQGGPAGRDVKFSRGLRAGRSDLAVRVPELRPLSSKTVIVFGTGGVGGPSAVEFAKAGVGLLRLVDHDYVDPATSVRSSVGFMDAGRHKVAALADHIGHHHPLTKTVHAALRLGGVRPYGGDETELDQLRQLLDSADLLFDGTANHGTSQFLCELALSHGIPYVGVSTTQGAWGGRVVRFRPDDGPCYECLLRHISDQHASGDPPVVTDLVPREDPAGEVRPEGCADATFTGSGFDVAAAALAGVRLAVSTLCEGAPGGYPTAQWNVAILHFRDPDGSPTAGRTYHQTIAPHPACDACLRRSGSEPASCRT